MLNHVMIAQVPPHSQTGVPAGEGEGGDTDVGGVTVIFAVTQSHTGERDTHVEFAVWTQRGHRQMCSKYPTVCPPWHSAIIWTHRTRTWTFVDNVDTGLCAKRLHVPA